MPISPLAGKPAPKELLVDPSQLEHEYYERHPDLRSTHSAHYSGYL
jgi:phosphoglucomutase